MQVYANHAQAAAHAEPTALAIGIFDGVHLGHRALLSEALRLAKVNKLRSLVYTFDPHPAQILNAALAPRLIEPISKRLERLAAMGFDAVLVEPFSRQFATTTAQDYVHHIVAAALQARHVVVGAGFTFGSKQMGKVSQLQEWGKSQGFVAHPIQHVTVLGAEVSSTRVRTYVGSGQMPEAAALLGRFYSLFGTVVTGAQRGRSLGFPTANVRPENALLPKNGVYAARAYSIYGDYEAVVNVGVAPTFSGDKHVKVEAHLLGYGGESLYDHPMRLDFVELLRSEQRFDGVEALKAQINLDITSARACLARTP